MAVEGIETRVATRDSANFIVMCGLEKAISQPIIAITGQDVIVVLLIVLAPPGSNNYFTKPGKRKVETKLFSTRKLQKTFFSQNHPPSPCIQWLEHNIMKVPRSVDYSYIKCLSYGNLSSFKWMESPIKYIEHKNEKLFHVYYSALNFKDVLIATGKLPAGLLWKNSKDIRSSPICFEFSGREDGTGRRVCGIGMSAFATSVLADPRSLMEVPDQWTLEEAATVPVVYSTCYYGLIMKAKLKERQSILIHSGTGGVGQAAINIALAMNCEIYTTVGK
ncbi:Fatty acid synthase [Araneus ventricosus]|uniref:Fatty acid synthase n=1 Tax=Araneus ventricosus TaxID=182803 RepID=A0A4Y2GRR9_ARAVE|nr:Fatty acid synthase [Araneus ventricosus]